MPHRVRGGVVEHLLECASLDGLGGLAGLDELLDDDCAELFGLALRGFALGWGRRSGRRVRRREC